MDGGWNVLRVEHGAGAATVPLPPAWQWPRAEGKSGGDRELWERPFPVGILITCNLMACLSTTPPPRSQPRRMLESPTDATWVPPPEILIPMFQDAAWHEIADNSPGASNEQPGLRTVTQTVSFLLPL